MQPSELHRCRAESLRPPPCAHFMGAAPGRRFPRFRLSQQRAEPAGAPAAVAGILKTLDTGRYDDKNGLNKVRNETMLLGRMPGRGRAKSAAKEGAGEDGWLARGLCVSRNCGWCFERGAGALTLGEGRRESGRVGSSRGGCWGRCRGG